MAARLESRGRFLSETLELGIVDERLDIERAKSALSAQKEEGGMDMPLERIRVVDFTQWAAGPSACAILADWGAEVIKLEHPQGGDPSRGILAYKVLPFTSFNLVLELDNRGKKSLAVDMKLDQGREIVHKLIEKSDVFVTSFLPDNLRRLKLDYETLSQINPKLIYARISAYGERGPEKERGGYETTAYAARGGFMMSTGEPGSPPIKLPRGLGDHQAAMYLAGGITLALFVRERTGIGQEVNLSLLGTSTWGFQYDVAATLSSGQDLPWLSRKEETNPLCNSYETKDGKWLQLMMMQTDLYWREFCKVLEIEHLEHDLSFDSHEKRCENNVLLISILDKNFVTKTRDEWARRLDAYSLIWGPCQTIYEVVTDPQVIENEYVVDVDHPIYEKIKLVASPVQLSKTSVKIRSAAPELGQHTEEILLEIGYTWDDIIKLKEQRVTI